MITENTANDFEFIVISSDNKIYSDNIKYFVESLVKYINLEEAVQDFIVHDYCNFV